MNLNFNLNVSALAILLALASVDALGQEDGNRDQNNKIIRGPYETNRLFDNLFINGSGGINIYHGENDSHGSLGKRLAPALDFGVGKWVTPSVALRLGYSGLKAKGWTDWHSIYAKGKADKGIFREKFGISYLHGDVMWNFSNAVSGYKETRTWNFVPFVGFGWVHSYGNSTVRNEIGVSVWLLNTIRLCDLMDLTLEGRHLFVNQRLDGVVSGRRYEGMTSVCIGVNFKLNRRGFKRVEKPDYTFYQNRVSALEKDNTVLAGKNKQLAEENEILRQRKPEVMTIEGKERVKASPVALFFSLGKATLDKKELANLDFYVQNAIRADKNKVFTLIGTADSATGSKEVNQRLSEQRMQYVFDLLVRKYGIPETRLIKKAEGDTNDRFPDPALNRSVIIE